MTDYMYLKVSKLITLDNLEIEGVKYVADKENKLQEIDRVIGHPLYHYELDVELATNEEGLLIGVGDSELNSVVVTTDAEAFGFGGGGLIDIIAEGE